MPSLRDMGIALPSTAPMTAADYATLDAAGMGQLRKGWNSGRVGADINSALADVASLRASGQNAQADARLADVQGLRNIQAAYTPAVGRVEDINGLSSGIDYTLGLAGQAGASMLDPIAASTAIGGAGRVLGMIPGIGPAARVAGAVGGILAPYAINQQQAKGEFYGNVMDDPQVMQNFTPQQINDKANVVGLTSGALDTAIPGLVGNKLAGGFLRKLPKPKMGFLPTVGLDMLGEGGTEMLQGEIGRAMHSGMNPSRSTAEDSSNRLNEFVGGFLGASPYSAAGAAAHRFHNGTERVGQAVSDAAGTVVDMAGQGTDAVKQAVDKARGKVVDLQGDLRAASAAPDPRVRRNALEGFPDDPAVASNPEAFRQWYAEMGKAAQHQAVGEALTGLASQGDEQAAQMLQALQAAGPEQIDDLVKQASAHVVEAEGLQQLSAQAQMREDIKRKVQDVGAAVGAGVRKGAGAAAGAAKTVLGGLWQGLRRKQNAQVAADDLGGQTVRGQEDIYSQPDLTAAARTREEAQKRSYARAELMGEILAQRAKDEAPRYTAHRVSPTDIAGHMTQLGHEISDLADSWAVRAFDKDAAVSTKGKSADAKTASPQTAFPALQLRLNSIARTLSTAYGSKAPEALAALRQASEDKAQPFFDYLQSELTNVQAPNGAAHDRQVREQAAARMVKEIEPDVQLRLQHAGIDLSKPHVAGQLLDVLEGVARAPGTQISEARLKQLEAGMGKGGVARILNMLHLPDAEEQQSLHGLDHEGREVTTTDSGVEMDENGDVVDATETTKFDKHAANLNVDNSRKARVYRFYNMPASRTEGLDGKGDPFARNTSEVTQDAIDAWESQNQEALDRNGKGLPKSSHPLQQAPRPWLFHLKGQKDALEATQAALQKQLKINIDPETGEGAIWDVAPRSAMEMLTRNGPISDDRILTLRRDYARQTARKYESSEDPRNQVIARKAYEAVKDINRVLADRMDARAGADKTAMRMTPAESARVLREAKEFLETHGMVVAERGRASDNDAQMVTPDQVIALARNGAERWSETRVGKTEPETILHFKSDLGGKSGTIQIDSRELMRVARSARYAQEQFDESKSFSNQNINKEYLQDLLDGIAGIIGSGHVEGLPWIEVNGKKHAFTEKTVPGGLPLATTSFAGFQQSGGGRVTQAQLDKEGPTVEQEQDKDFYVPDHRTEIDRPVDGTHALTDAEIANQGLNNTPRAPRAGADSVVPGANRSGQRYAEAKTDATDRVASEFAKGDEVFDAQRQESGAQGFTAYDRGVIQTNRILPREMAKKGAAVGAQVAQTIQASFEEGINQVKAFLRAAQASPKQDGNSVVGGPQYLAPAIHALNGATVSQLGTTAQEKAQVADLRVQAARLLKDSTLALKDKVALAQTLFPPEARDKITGPTVLAALQKVADRAAGPQRSLEGPAGQRLTKAQRGAISDAAVEAFKGPITKSVSDRTAAPEPKPANMMAVVSEMRGLVDRVTDENNAPLTSLPPHEWDDIRRQLGSLTDAVKAHKEAGGMVSDTMTSALRGSYQRVKSVLQATEPKLRQERREGTQTAAPAFDKMHISDLGDVDTAALSTNDRRKWIATVKKWVDTHPIKEEYPGLYRKWLRTKDAHELQLMEEEAQQTAAPEVAAGEGKTSPRPAGAGAKNSQTGSSRFATSEEIQQAKDWFHKVLGQQASIKFEELTGYSGEWIDAENVAKISTTAAAGVLQTTYHEALHAFFSKMIKGNDKLFAVMKSLAEDKALIERVHALLDGYPEAQKQLMQDGEERLAYVFQFHQAGLLDLPTQPKTLFGKIKRFFAGVLGMITDSQRATAVLESFAEGKMAEPSVAGEVIAKHLQEGTTTAAFARKFDKTVQRMKSTVFSAQMTLARSESETAQKLGRMLWANPGDEAHAGGQDGYLNAKHQTALRYSNELSNSWAGLSPRDVHAVGEALQSMTRDQLQAIPYAPVRKAALRTRALLDRFYQYMTDERGMNVAFVKDYYPRVWDTNVLAAKQDEFVNMLVTKYSKQLDNAVIASQGQMTHEDVARRIHAKLIESTVGEHIAPARNDGVLAPFFGAAENRTLEWLEKADVAPYLTKDPVQTLTTYFHQGARAAEYTHRFGQDGRKLDAMMKDVRMELTDKNNERVRAGELTQEQANAKVDREMDAMAKAVGAMEGTLGKDISPNMRAFSTWMTVYQNVRLLPLALFSQAVDPLGMVARGATMKEAWETYIGAMKEVFRTWGDLFRDQPKERKQDAWARLAEAVGSVDAAMFNNHAAQEYASAYMTPAAKKINDAYFKYNGMEAWNRGMRVGATRSAVLFIQRHAQEPSQHSARWLKELGLTKADLNFDADGQLITDKQGLMAQGVSKEDAEARIDRLYTGINRWVQGAIITPNAAQRPAWASDPHYSMFFHLKQFSYSFHQTVLKRAVKEMEYGNMAPIGAFMWYVPVMIASDVTKGLLLNGGELPPHLKGMDLGGWLKHGVERAGVMGIGQIGVEAEHDLWSLAGPGPEQVINAITDPIGKTVSDALPMSPLAKSVMRTT